MNEKRNKVLSFPSPVPLKADYQRVKSVYTVGEIKQLFGLSERTIRRWTEQGIIPASSTGKQHQGPGSAYAVTEAPTAACGSSLQSRQSLLRSWQLSSGAITLRSCYPNRTGIFAGLFQSGSGLPPA